MPKHCNKKTVSVSEPYTVNKKTTDQVSDVSDQTSAQDVDSEALYCDKCSQSVDQLIQCESCEVWFCSACETIPGQTMEIIFAYNQIHWVCHACNDQADQLIQKSQILCSDQSHTTDTISQIVTESLNKITEQFTKALKDVKDYIKMSLEDKREASAAAATVTMDTSQADTHPPGIISSSKLPHGGGVLEVVDEYVERERRKNNLIIYNFPEPTEVSSNEQQVLKDSEALTGLFHTEFKVTDAKIRRATCLGAFKSILARPQLLLVEFSDISIKRSISKHHVKFYG